MDFLSRLRRSFATRWAEHRTYYELARLADRERADIGLENGDLRSSPAPQRGCKLATLAAASVLAPSLLEIP